MAVDDLLSDEGFLYASTPPVEEGDPGRFHALFGRDSLIAALQLLPARPEVARGTLRALAARQGRSSHPGTLEEPGRIGHEFRDAAPAAFLEVGWPDEGEFAYYGTADATSWFIVLAVAAGGYEDATRAAGDWLAGALDRGGGLVRHAPGSWPALTQQGWRDTLDPTHAYGGGILRPDGTAPEPPLADIDSQAVAYAALRALAALEPDEGAAHPRDSWAARADALRARLSGLATDAVAIEAGDRIVPGAGSQLGWLLWADALEPDARDAAAERLCRPDILTGFGLRTLSSESPVFAPHAYHRGSVWPFDSWLGWGGLRAAGREAEAERVRAGVLAALDRLGNAPELYAVTEAGPERVPIANQIQAWTVGARWALENGWDGRVA
jgi:glycogen debranching enzyme